mgnify:FL=1|tara:strand:- start:5625 stop:5894 length:270 start_codon:yes stop_codon:yes gene_type:complete
MNTQQLIEKANKHFGVDFTKKITFRDKGYSEKSMVVYYAKSELLIPVFELEKHLPSSLNELILLWMFGEQKMDDVKERRRYKNFIQSIK